MWDGLFIRRFQFFEEFKKEKICRNWIFSPRRADQLGLQAISDWWKIRDRPVDGEMLSTRETRILNDKWSLPALTNVQKLLHLHFWSWRKLTESNMLFYSSYSWLQFWTLNLLWEFRGPLTVCEQEQSTRKRQKQRPSSICLVIAICRLLNGQLMQLD